MTKITRALRLESRGLIMGWPEFDDRYLIDCRSGRESAATFFKTSGIREQIELLGNFHLLRFEDTYVKLVTSVEDQKDYEAQRIGKYVHGLAGLANTFEATKA